MASVQRERYKDKNPTPMAPTFVGTLALGQHGSAKWQAP